MKLKNVKIGTKVVVKKQDHYDLSKGDLVEVVDIDTDVHALDYLNILVENNNYNCYWLNHKDIKKLKPEKVNTNIVTLDGSKDTLVDFR